MAGRYPYFQPQGTSAPRPTVPPPHPPPSSTIPLASTAAIYDYNHGGLQRHPSYISRLAPGQAPPRESTSEQLSKPAIVIPPQEETTINTKEFYCDSCDLQLESAQALKSHFRSHVKCTECSFEGAPKIVKAHYQALHGKFSGSGFKTVTVAIPGCRVQRFRICVGNRPEDIQRWIEERKKRFPRQQQHPPKERNDTTMQNTTTVAPPPLSSGMSSLLAGYGSSDSESEDNGTGSEIQNPISDRVPLSSSVSSPSDVVCVKCDVDNSEKNHPQVTISSGGSGPDLSIPVEVQRINRPCKFFLKNGSCMKGDTCRFIHETKGDSRYQEATKKSSTATRTTSLNRDRKRKRGGPTTSDTLLRKLLASDMERESILTMQLLQYIVEKDFFGCHG